MLRHSLTAKDTTARTATCSVCGPVEIRPAGAGWVCLNKKRANEAGWRARNPERVRDGRRARSAHHLTEWNPETGLAYCPVDGWVPRQAVPRGWMCSVRAVEMGRTLDPTRVPDERCQVCEHFGSEDNPLVDGLCGFHRGRNWGTRNLAHGLGTFYTYSEERDHALAVASNGGRLVGLQAYDAQAAKVRAKESAVPGWRMTGENVPKDEWKKWNELLAAEGL